MNPALLAAKSASVPHFVGMSGPRVSPRLGNPPSPNPPPPPRAPQPGVRDCCGLRTGAGGPERGWGPSPCPGGREPLCPRGRGRLWRPGPATRWRACPAVTPPSHASCCRARLPQPRCGSGPRNGCSREPEAGRVQPAPGVVVSSRSRIRCASSGGEWVQGWVLGCGISTLALQRKLGGSKQPESASSLPQFPHRVTVGSDRAGALRWGPLCPAAAPPTALYVRTGDTAKCFAAVGCK